MNSPKAKSILLGTVQSISEPISDDPASSYQAAALKCLRVLTAVDRFMSRATDPRLAWTTVSSNESLWDHRSKEPKLSTACDVIISPAFLRKKNCAAAAFFLRSPAFRYTAEGAQ